MVATLPGLRVGLSCTLELDTPDAEGDEALKSRIADLSDDVVVIAWPTRRGQNVAISAGDLAFLTVPTFDARGQQLPTLYLDGEIMARNPGSSEAPASLSVRVLAVGRQQQRTHFRLYVTLQPIDCAVWERAFGASETDGYWRPIGATVTDMSGGGVGLQSDDKVDEGARLRLRFPYPYGAGECIVEARVAKVFASSAGGRARYKVGTQFEQMDRQQRERIMRCIHRFQIEQRRREHARPAVVR
jgi:c-di-GMP-binding flagellar brake protein YcgR